MLKAASMPRRMANEAPCVPKHAGKACVWFKQVEPIMASKPWICNAAASKPPWSAAAWLEQPASRPLQPLLRLLSLLKIYIQI